MLKFIGEFANEPWRTREHSDSITFLDELAHERRTEPGPNARDNRYVFSLAIDHNSSVSHA